MAYTLITANRNYSSWSLRPWVLMKVLGVDFTDRVEPFAALSNYQAFRKFSPVGQVPALIDGERTIWDSLAITLYLAERHDGVWPGDESARAFAQCCVAEMHSGFADLRSHCPMNVGVRVKGHSSSKGLKHDISRLQEIFEEGLERFGGPWLAGANFTAIDAFFAPVAYRIRTYALDVGKGQKWVDHILAHPAMQHWEEEALQESWREQGHEEELAATGKITADYRGGNA